MHSGLTCLGFAVGRRIPGPGSTGCGDWILVPHRVKKNPILFVGFYPTSHHPLKRVDLNFNSLALSTR